MLLFFVSDLSGFCKGLSKDRYLLWRLKVFSNNLRTWEYFNAAMAFKTIACIITILHWTSLCVIRQVLWEYTGLLRRFSKIANGKHFVVISSYFSTSFKTIRHLKWIMTRLAFSHYQPRTTCWLCEHVIQSSGRGSTALRLWLIKQLQFKPWVVSEQLTVQLLPHIDVRSALVLPTSQQVSGWNLKLMRIDGKAGWQTVGIWCNGPGAWILACSLITVSSAR